MDSHAGPDYPDYWWQLATGQPVRDHRSDYHSGVAGHLVRGELAHLYSVISEGYPLTDRQSVPRTVWNTASSPVTQPSFDYVSLDDPDPFVRDWPTVGAEVLGER